jgi:hypothetical protein
MAAVQGPTDRHHLRFAIFHDGNPGHLWRGEFSSLLGDAVVSAGVVMWLCYLTYSPMVVTMALLALGLPALLAGPLGATLTRVEEPAGLFKLVGRLRVGFALALIAMHYVTVLPVLYLLLFGLSLCGRLRSSLRVAAMRACLAPGEPERVASSTHFAAVVVAVIGPLLAALLYVLIGQRILLVAIGGALLFLLGTSSDALLDALPPARRAFLLAQPERDENQEEEDEEALDDEDGEVGPDAALIRFEAALPEWDQWGPGNIAQAIADVRAGLRVIGGGNVSTTALRALATLALVGGGLSVLEVFYVTDHLYLPTYYLGALLAAEGAGLAIGATFWSDRGRRGSGRIALLVGTLGTGVALVALAAMNAILPVLVVAVGLGIANALAVEGARAALRAGFNGLERRAVAAAEMMLAALCALVGALIFYFFHQGLTIARPGGNSGATQLTLLQPFSVAEIFLGAGVGLAVAGIVFAVLLNTGGVLDKARARRERARAAKRRSGTRGRILADRDDYDDEEDEGSGYYPAAGGQWDEEDDEGGGQWDDDADAYEDRRAGRGYGGARRAGWDEADEDDEGWDMRGRARGGRGGGRPGPRTPPRGGGRGGWR